MLCLAVLCLKVLLKKKMSRLEDTEVPVYILEKVKAYPAGKRSIASRLIFAQFDSKPIPKVCGDCTTDGSCEDCSDLQEEEEIKKVLKCKREDCTGLLKYINGAYRCEDCWKTYFVHELD